jgi:hypothetical protein
VTVTALLLWTVRDSPAQLAGRLARPATGRLLIRLADDAPEGSGIPRADGDLYALAWELRSDDPVELLADAADLSGRLGDQVDRSRSIALAGSDHVMLAGPGPAVLVYALRRLPWLTPAAFCDYWQSVHAEFGRRALAGQGYRQVHADPALSASLAESAGVTVHDLDGAVVSESTSWEASRKRRANPDLRAAGSAALADEDNFIDHTRSMAMRYQETAPADR